MLGALVALVALLGGCGGGGGGDSTTSAASEAPLTKAEVIRKGDAICQVGNEASQTEIEKFAKEKGFGSSEPSKAQFEEIVTEVLVPNLEQQADELDALVPPAEDQDEIDAIVAALRESISAIAKDPNTLEGSVLAKPIQLENAYGFKVCGGG
jgi:hypothetical protein